MSSALQYREAAVAFDCAGDTLQGVIATPSGTVSERLGMVIVVGGPQYRIGSHRQFVRLARRVAAQGHAVLRFDVRGMGDSTGTPRGFEESAQDIAAAIDALQRTVSQVQEVALWGLCDGASASLLYLDSSADPRVRGLCLLNPWIRSEQSIASTHVKHYYKDRLLQPSFWSKLLRGGIGREALQALVANLKRMRGRSAAQRIAQPAYQDRMEQAWQRFDGKLCVLLSERDWTAKEFEDHVVSRPAWVNRRGQPGMRWHRILGADHTFSERDGSLQVEQLTVEWLRS